ncbi:MULTISPECIES: patatin-like phospholipase family protein [Bradyrhizobium]|uniref:patatin-like phospholipase family protein n=1 Tax=Bradyrhizobium TaxID=374 RepID=UPI00155EF22C|nr:MULTISPECIES: patatin-like phospholipase family protein [Bradyrhizobium]MDD1518928.1 patatin [Bradyrhizobium sp. WBAH30]MDD1541074.1 patatin [Bradyrhizobium sp. WBAH41]MDD1557302.1 patatin [Bradyrhizobium sp. WBAH23]MDD1563709.1 patatin [Bradyrhizobium sp. WBAH33]MDD1590122.1 patatin [Bradyrhizobium sp. WBAH42]
MTDRAAGPGGASAAERPLSAVAFSGGLGLGAYHGGVFEALTSLRLPIDWVTGSSAGAITAALIAGSARDDRLRNLRSYWHAPSSPTDVPNASRHTFAWLSSISTRVLGHSGFFHPRLPIPASHYGGLYDLGPTRERLQRLIDFGRLNGGDPRVTICATDVESGDAVLFDTASERIEMDHILASCGFLPEFAPVQIAGRWLVDGGFSLNAPFDPILETAGPLRLYVVDLFPRDGKVPDGLEAASERKSDLTFGNQTFQRLGYALEARQLRAELQDLHYDDEVHLLSYRPGREEAGPEKSFDLSETAMAQRWCAGFLDMQYAASLTPVPNEICSVRRP